MNWGICIKSINQSHSKDVCKEQENRRTLKSDTINTITWSDEILIHLIKLLPPTNEVAEGNVFTPVYDSFCSQGVVKRDGWWKFRVPTFSDWQKFHDISMISRVFLVNFQVFFKLFLNYDFQMVLNINMQTYWVSFEQKINHFNYTPN